jgi:hypothetical protein
MNAKVMECQAAGSPGIAVDAKKKALVGNVKNGGRDLRPQGQPEPGRRQDFVIPALGKVAPDGISDITANVGWGNGGVEHDTAALAVERISRWWFSMGSDLYPQATQLRITAESGGSNGYRVRLWTGE